jgi:tetratricopeptide (TPR) repeat protein
LNERDPESHVVYATALLGMGETAAGGDACRRAIAVAPHHAPAYFFLGHTLTAQGQFAEALRALQVAHEMGKQSRGWPYPSAAAEEACRRYLALEGRLPAVLAEREKPSAGERVEFAWVARLKGQHANAVRLYERAFQDEPRLAKEVASKRRFHAAASAVLAAGGNGEGAPEAVAERTRLRKLALVWLQAELAGWKQAAAGGAPQARLAAQRVGHWKINPDLAGVRGMAVEKLPPGEQNDWRNLWEEVERFLKTALGSL